MADTKPLVPIVPIKPLVPVKPSVVFVRPQINPLPMKLVTPVVVNLNPLESDAVLREMFTILDKSIYFSENSEFSILRKKYDRLKGQSK